MSPRDWFSVAVRVLGLLSIGRGMYDAVYVIAFSVSGGESVSAKFPGFDLLLAILYTLVGLYLLRGAKAIVNLAYPQDPTEESKDDIT